MNSKIALEEVPTLITLAALPGSEVVVVLTVIVAAAGPVGPVGPVGPKQQQHPELGWFLL